MRRTLLIAVLSLPLIAVAGDYRLSWTPYETPDGHDIQIYCRVDAEDATWRANVPASESARIVTIEAGPGQTIGCQIRARRMVGNDKEQWPKSEFSPEATYTVPFAMPATPADLTITPADRAR